jgi:hypothetical protein
MAVVVLATVAPLLGGVAILLHFYVAGNCGE